MPQVLAHQQEHAESRYRASLAAMPAIPLRHLPQAFGTGKEHPPDHFLCPSSIYYLSGLTDLTKLIIKYDYYYKSVNKSRKYGLFVPLFPEFVNTPDETNFEFFTPSVYRG